MASQIENRRTRDNLENVKQRLALLPDVDVYENPSEILLLVDLPGVAREDLQINLDKDKITIEARRKASPEHAPQFLEFHSVDFRRSFSMPGEIDRDKVDAEFRAGVLKLHLPKSEAVRPRQIQVRSA